MVPDFTHVSLTPEISPSNQVFPARFLELDANHFEP